MFCRRPYALAAKGRREATMMIPMTAKTRFLVSVPMILLSACASQKDIVGVKDDLQQLKHQSETIRTQSAGSYSDLQKMRDQMGAFKGTLGEMEYRNRQQMSRLAMEDSLLVHKADELESRLQNIERYLGIPVPQKPVAAPAPLATAVPDSTAAPAAAIEPSSPAPPAAGSSTLFNEGAQLFSNGRYAPARDKFSELLKESPQSDLADDAQFFIAESWFAEKVYDKAILDYQVVIAKYTKSDKRPAALFKQARAFELLGDDANAKTRYRDLVNVYPKSPEAAIARKKMN